MLAFSDIIDFLLHLLGDDEARAEFERDPNGALDRAGLDGVTAQDIRDARLQLADSGAVHATDHHGAYHGDDPVREIGYTARHYAAEEHASHGASPVDHDNTLISIDDRDTLFFQSISDDDVTVTDNSVAISGSFNQDNSDDDVTAIQDNDTVNALDSFNGSFNEDNDVTAVQDNDVAVDIDTGPVEAGGSETAGPAAVPDTAPEPPAEEPDPVDAADQVDGDQVDGVDDTPADVEDDPVDLDDDVPADTTPAG